MSRQPEIDSVASDPLISSDFAVFGSPSRSRVPSLRRTIQSTLSSPMPPTLPPSESDPLLRSARPRKPFYRPRPLWLVPFAITAALARGMTTAPRVEVFTQLACARLHPHPYNHTAMLDSFTPSFSHSESHPPPVFLTFETDDDDPRHLPSNQCLSDSAVQASAARLQTMMTTTMGLLSALTTGWWGHFGERYGRTRVMAMATFGLFITDLMFILVSTPGSAFSGHGHKLLIIAPVIEGLLGGWSTLQSSTSAYVSDCTSSGSRAAVFSRFSGVFFFGFSMGPAIAGWIIRNRIGLPADAAKSVAPVFYLSACCSLLNFLLVLFVFPESLSKDKREMAQREYRVEHSAKGKGRDPRPVPEVEEGASSSVAELEEYKRPGIIMTFLSPLAVFLPVKVTDAGGLNTVNDWSLLFLGVGLFATVLATGIFQLKYLYADHIYGWGAEQLGYYISFLGGSRAAFLLLILPLFISTFKPKPKSAKKNGINTKPKITKAHLAREMSFDLLVARGSVFVDIISNVLVILCPTPGYKVHQQITGTSGNASHSGAALFVMSSGIACFGSAVMPAVQSLALCILQARSLIAGGEVVEGKGGEGVGRLFGAFAVVQATGQMILGPMMFGLIYSSTVATYPQAIFVVASGVLFIGLCCFLLVRNPVESFKGKALGKKKMNQDDEVERGRSRVSKDLFGASTSRD